MKRSISTAIALSAVLTTPTFASGPYDGVYQYGLSQSFYSVHQNGNQLLVISLDMVPMQNVQFSLGSYTVTPSMIGDWDYSLGFVAGNRARISGVNLLGTCTTTSDVSFENGVATATFVSAVNTVFGTTQGVNCALLFRDITASTGSTITLRKIF